MTKTQQQVILAVLLGGVMIFMWWRQIREVNKFPPAVAKAIPPETVAVDVKEVLSPLVSYRISDRDPLLSPIEAASLLKQGGSGGVGVILPQLTVQGMVWGGPRPMCIVNGKVFSIGDEVEGAQILEIKKGEVLLMYQGRTFTATPKEAFQQISPAEK